MPGPPLITIARQRLGRPVRLLKRVRLDIADQLSGRRNPMIAPRWMGLPSQFPHLGQLVVDRILLGPAGLEPHHRVLDVGCGSGRVAAALTEVLDSGSYEGIDVMPKAVRWAQRKITPRHPNFRFQVADVQNALYNPDGDVPASDYVFPFDDDEFDRGLATSLFTHLVPLETKHYLEEVGRTLKSGGVFVSSYMLLNQESEALVEEGIPDRPAVQARKNLHLSDYQLDEAGYQYRTPHPDLPEHYIAVPEDDVRAFHDAAGFEVEKIVYGRWCGRKAPGGLGQDFVIARRR